MAAILPSFKTSLLRSAAFIGLLLGSLAWSGCSSMGGGDLSLETVARMSPAAEVVDSGAVMPQARLYVQAHPGSVIALGSGDSMMPLYRDNTVIVVQPVPMAELKRGMTVVYMSKQGWPVAHALVGKSGAEWVTMGLNNPGLDEETVSGANYVGVVVKAYQMSVNPMLALSRALSTETEAVALAAPSPDNSFAAVTP